MPNKKEQEITRRWKLLEIPLVSICCITYNHEKYIAEAIDGFLMQETTFPFEILIGEDCSTDGTMEIINIYKNLYPNLIKVITGDTNLGMQKNFTRIFEACGGRYIALCEGDDFWTSPHKLQRQIDFLENNSDYAICCHKSENYHQENNTVLNYFPAIEYEKDLTIYDLFQANIANTCTFVYRNQNIKIPLFFENFSLGDWPLHMLHAEYGKIKYLPQSMARYRVHSGGIWSGGLLFEKLEHVNAMLKAMDIHFNKKYHDYIYKTVGKNLFDQSLCLIDKNDHQELCAKLAHSLNLGTVCFIKYKLKEYVYKNFPNFFQTLRKVVQKYQYLTKRAS